MPKLGSTLFRYHRLASTNDLARELAASGVSEGVALMALEQTAGRGRQGRSWASPAGEGLYISLIIRPRIRAAASALITLASAVAVAESLADLGIAADIKWPNDVMARGRKISGILVESAIEGESMQYAVVGVGINVTQRAFPPDLNQPATSIFLELGQDIALDDILRPFLHRIEHWYRNSILEPEQVVRRWEELSSYARGCEVRVTSSDGWFEGVTLGLTPAGALVVELSDGRRREVIAGEVSLSSRGSVAPNSTGGEESRLQ